MHGYIHSHDDLIRQQTNSYFILCRSVFLEKRPLYIKLEHHKMKRIYSYLFDLLNLEI